MTDEEAYYVRRRKLSLDDLPEGKAVQCTNEGTGQIYRWMNRELHHYPNGIIASSWDADWRYNIANFDCNGLVVGSDMSMQNISEGKTVQCPDDADGARVYRWENGKLHYYPTAEIARSWDENWRENILTLNCESLEIGAEMRMHYPDCHFDYGIEPLMGDHLIDAVPGGSRSTLFSSENSNYSPNLKYALGCSFYDLSCIFNSAVCGACKAAIPALMAFETKPLCLAGCVAVVEAAGGGPEDPIADFVAAQCGALCVACIGAAASEPARAICESVHLC